MHKRSVAFTVPRAQRSEDRARAERAIGRKLKPAEIVHHHSLSQLVICQDREYHRLLHFLTYRRRLKTDKQFAEYERGMAGICMSPPLWFNCETWAELEERSRRPQW